jgi:hypothetical protein
VAAAVVVTASALTLSAAAAQPDHEGGFATHNLVSDLPGLADVTDATLVNPWGMSQTPTSPVWVSDNGTNSATLYRGDGVVGPSPRSASPSRVPATGPLDRSSTRRRTSW